MGRMISSLFALLLILAGAGCASSGTRITQVATIDTLLAGLYDGSESVGDLKRYGTLGIGTLDKLDGEMMMLDGVVYQIRADGRVYRPEDGVTVPFASVVDFRPDLRTRLHGPASFGELIRELDRQLPNRNILAALHIRGSFSRMHTRSVPAQEKPYRPLAEVTRTQPEFHLGAVEGDLVGFRLPDYLGGINVPGWHLHFVTADRTRGGHVLDFELAEGCAEMAWVYDFRMILPRGSEMFADMDLSVDRSRELLEVESAAEQRRGGGS